MIECSLLLNISSKEVVENTSKIITHLLYRKTNIDKGVKPPNMKIQLLHARATTLLIYHLKGEPNAGFFKIFGDAHLDIKAISASLLIIVETMPGSRLLPTWRLIYRHN